MDLFEMLENTTEERKAAPVDLVDELDMIIQKHGISVPLAVLEELASLYSDPPPWAPWK